MIPGMNLLNLAMGVLGTQQLTYRQNTGRNSNGIGNDVATYAADKAVRGMIQPIKRTKYEQQGLDLQKNYVTVWVSQDVIDLKRDFSGDLFIWQNKAYQCQSKDDWFGQDGWVSVVCVEVSGYA